MSHIARHSSIDKARLKKFQNNQKTDSIIGNVHNLDNSFIDTNKLDIDKLLSNIDEKYSIVLQLMYLEGYSQTDIAKRLDIPHGTVKTRLRKAISLLRDHLKEEKLLFVGIFSIIIIIALCMIL